MFIRWNPLDRAHTTHTADDYRFDAVCGLDLKDQSNVTPQKRDWPSFSLPMMTKKEKENWK
jgi:hypothetical protein